MTRIPISNVLASYHHDLHHHHNRRATHNGIVEAISVGRIQA
ncbi:MAG: hypothetical protein ABJN65_13355 [Parasphingorhabdus sp.]